MAGALTISTLNNDTGVLATQNGMTGIAKAWVNYKGTSTQSVRNSFNISSVTYNSTGDYTLNFTTAMPNADYAVTGTAGGGSSNPNNYLTGPSTATTMSTTQFRFQTRNDGAGFVDSDTIMLSVFA
jgi:hypothetical protein